MSVVTRLAVELKEEVDTEQVVNTSDFTLVELNPLVSPDCNNDFDFGVKEEEESILDLRWAPLDDSLSLTASVVTMGA